VGGRGRCPLTLMGRLHEERLEGRVYVCRHCNAHLARHSDIESRQFHSRNGKAYLFRMVVNISCGSPEDRRMVTGLHTVSDIFCRVCAQNLGWRYEYAYEESQRYKVRESRVLSCGRIGGRLVGLTHLTPSLCHWQVGKVVIEREKMVDAVQHLGGLKDLEEVDTE